MIQVGKKKPATGGWQSLPSPGFTRSFLVERWNSDHVEISYFHISDPYDWHFCFHPPYAIGFLYVCFLWSTITDPHPNDLCEGHLPHHSSSRSQHQGGKQTNTAVVGVSAVTTGNLFLIPNCSPHFLGPFRDVLMFKFLYYLPHIAC